MTSDGNVGSVEMSLLAQKEEAEQITPPLKNSWYCVYNLLLSVSSVMLSVGIAVGSLNPSLLILQEFYNHTYTARYDQYLEEGTKTLLISLTTSMMLAGGFVGALSIRIILSFFSRKQSMIIINLTNVVSVIMITLGGRLIPSYEVIIFGRFIMGLFCGCGMNLIPIVVAELCALARQTFYLSLIGVNLSFGGLLGLLLGFEQIFGTYELWPVLLSLSAIPSLVYLIFSFWLPESPFYLLRHGKRDLAFKTLCHLRHKPGNEEITRDMHLMDKNQNCADGMAQMSLLRMFKSKRYFRQLILVVITFAQAQLCGINGVGMYTNLIFVKAGFTQHRATIASAIVYSVQFAVALLGSIAVDRYGPKRLNLISSSAMALSLFVLTAAMASIQHEYSTTMAYVSVGAVTTYVLTWACGVNLTLFPMLGAFTTEITRETLYTFGGGIFWILSWFVAFISPHFMDNLKYGAFLPWAILNVVFFVYVAVYIPETKGRTSADIQGFIQNGKTNLPSLCKGRENYG